MLRKMPWILDQIPAHHLLIYFKEPYDSIDCIELWEIMDENSFLEKLLKVIRATMDDGQNCVKTSGEHSSSFGFHRGLRQIEWVSTSEVRFLQGPVNLFASRKIWNLSAKHSKRKHIWSLKHDWWWMCPKQITVSEKVDRQENFRDGVRVRLHWILASGIQWWTSQTS